MVSSTLSAQQHANVDHNMSNITAHPEKTAPRILALEKYCESNIHDGHKMVCPYEYDCRSSRPDNYFYEGQLSHVGKNYDLEIDGEPFRIVIVGQEYGHWHKFVSLSERHEMIAKKSAQVGFTGRNPHMRGTTSKLRLLFGHELGDDAAGEKLLDGHLFDGFALVNALLCSSLKAPRDPSQFGGGKGASSPLMRRNCTTHFTNTLKILEPTLIILQGQGVRKWVGELLGIGSSGPAINVGSFEGRSVNVLVFDHPSAGGQSGYWGNSTRSRYLLEKVAPAIRSLKKLAQ